MRKKFFIMVFLLAGVMFIFSGCAYYSDNFDFKFKDEYMADKYVDLLIPLEENDEFYTPYNCNIEEDIKIPEDSEIVNYNKDGYRSMLMHIKESRLHIFIDNYENTIHQLVFVPYYEGRYHDTYNEEMFLEFCNKYKKCRVAVFDKDGNIIQISKKIRLVSLGNFYLQDISYDVENNKINPDYAISVEFFAFIVIVWLFSAVGMIGSIITMIVYKINHNQWDRTYKSYIIASSLFNVPSAILFVMYIYSALGLSVSFTDFLMHLIGILISINIYAVPVIVNILVLRFFVFRERQLRLKKKLEEKHRAESLDKSENI
ncbi:MAG: hypothetical protein NC177_03820 [Ruminococcus flavefaciens]|nr:hypothetical protein [Ruminococcus flavefaciens]